MNTDTQLKKLYKKAEQSRNKIAAERDKLRELHSEIEDLLNSFDDGLSSIDDGLRTLKGVLIHYHNTYNMRDFLDVFKDNIPNIAREIGSCIGGGSDEVSFDDAYDTAFEVLTDWLKKYQKNEDREPE